MKKHKFNHMLAFVSTMALVAGSQTVYAQQATEKKATAPQETEEIIVTGFKASLQKSAEMKKEASAIVDVVTSEDIGKLPDKSIAESLMRLPGLATQRVNGRAQVISIRGFSPEFSTTLLNGRQQVSTNDSRKVEYDQYPAEFTSAAMVYKTPDASLLAHGVAGTIDIQTTRPLDYGTQAIVGSVRYEQNAQESLNSDASNKGHKEVISYIDQYADDTIGLALAYSATNSPTQGEKYNAWGYPQIGDENSPYVIGGVKPFVQSDVVKRNSVMGTLEYKPNESFSSTVDVFYSKFEEDQLLRGIELPLRWSSAVLQPGYTVTDGVVTKGTYTNVQGVIRSDATLTEATVYALGWNGKFAIGDTWEGEADISRSSADRTDEVLENYTGYIGGPDTLNFETTTKGTKFQSSLDYTDASKIRITNLQSWGGDFVPSSEGGQKGYDSLPRTEDAIDQIRLGASRDIDFGFIKKIELGVAHDVRSKLRDSTNQFYFALPNQATQAPLPSNTGTTDLSFIGFGSIISFNPLAPKQQGLYRLVPAVRADIISDTWSVDETINTVFFKLDIEADVAGMGLTGNVGAQWVDSDQSSNGFSANGVGNAMIITPQYDGISYNNLLPSTNLKLAITDKDFVKLGLGRTLTRVGMNDMRASSTFGVSNLEVQLNESSNILLSPWSASGGNPRIKPWVANNVDLSLEHYFDEGDGYVSVAAFYKELSTYVYPKQTLMDFTGFPVPSGLPTQPKMFAGFNTVPTNGNGGNVKGLEFTLSVSGDMITDALTGFGAVLTSSYTDSNITPPDSSSKKLPGLSKNVHGAQVYYEAHGFSVRVSENYRSDYLGDFSTNIGAREQRVVKATTLLDAQIGYTFDTGSLEGLSITLQGYNLNDEPTVTTQQGDELRVVDYQSYGRSYALNFGYTY